MRAWHFCGDKLRDGRPVPPDGEKLIHTGRLVMCESGLHASERIIDALKYAPGNTICRVEVGGKVKRDSDKLVCSKRTILWRIDGEKIFREFARWCALSVIDKWDAPKIVRRYLETGDESIRDATLAALAAWDARDARNDAMAAKAVAGAALDAKDARDAAMAAKAAAGAAWAAWDARNAAMAARNAAWDAAGDAQNTKLTEMTEVLKPMDRTVLK